MFESEGISVVLLDRVLDTQFISLLEAKLEGVKFARVDAEVADALKSDGTAREWPKAAEVFKAVAGEGTSVEFQSLKDAAVPAVLTVSEESRRMEDMMKMYGMNADSGAFPTEAKLILNADSALIERIDRAVGEDPACAEKMARQVYGLSLLSQRRLSAEELKKFLADSYAILELL